MTAYDFRAAVYILENAKAERVKVGVTVNNPIHRRDHVNDLWRGRKVTCQICGGRRLLTDGHVPQHAGTGLGMLYCPGGNALPLEKDITLAESHLEKLILSRRAGNTSVTRQINKLVKRIELYRRFERTGGVWRLRIAYYTKRAGDVELLSHEILAQRLDRQAPFGEVFCCSVSEATEAVEAALSQLGLLDSARKETRL